MIFFELVWTRPNHLGWAGSSGPLHYSHTTWTVEKKTQKKEQEVEEEGEADLQWLLSLAVMLVAKWRWLQAAVLLLLSSASLLFLFFSSSIIIFLFLSVFSSFPLLFCSFLLLPLLLSLSLIFIGKKTGEEIALLPLPSLRVGVGWPGRPLCNCPRGTSPLFFHQVASKWVVFVGIFLSYFGERGKRKAGEGNLLLPLLHVSRGRRRPTLSFKTTPFGSLFFF